MKAYTTTMMRQMDACMIQHYGLPSTVLMEDAATSLAGYFKDHIDIKKHILIVCGPGNNGGDGFALARLLSSMHYANIEVFCCVDEQHMSSDENVFYQVLKEYPIIMDTSKDVHSLKARSKYCDYIVDALFGTGLSRTIDGIYKDIIDTMNRSGKKIISIDMPSGVHGDDGSILGCCIHADVTLTLEGYKIGQFRYPGSACCGKIEVLPIHFPQCLQQKSKGITILDKPFISQLLPKRYPHSHKGSYGKALLVAGSKQMLGACCMCAKACLRSGVGTLTLFVPDCIYDSLTLKLEESMIISTASKDGYFAMEAVEQLKHICNNYDYLIIGNGMGRNDVTKKLVQVALQSEKACIVDGDALYELGFMKEELQRPYPTILTPHLKEMSYLTQQSIQAISDDVLSCVENFVNRYPSCTLVLKDQYTLIADTSGIYMNIIGNHSLAKGGSGDVLCGMIAGLYGQCKNCTIASLCGVYTHAYCADMLIKTKDANSILANDIIAYLQQAYLKLR